MTPVPVSVFMYHTVGRQHPDWLWRFLTIDYHKFDQQMATLKKMGCNTVTLGELYDYMANGTPLPKNPFVLTFDDGYLDNWVAVAPILKKYGFRGTVYMNPEFVDPSEICRPTLEDVWSKNASLSDLTWDGFLSWNEMRQLEKEGALDIQSHAMSHTWYFESSELIDFQHPNDPYIWMYWNRHQDKKYSYMADNVEKYKEYGAPIYKHGKSLAVRRYFPDENIHNELASFVTSEGQKAFFKDAKWKLTLESLHSELLQKYGEGRYEADGEYQKRIDYELHTSKQLLEENLNKKIDFFCWPGGGYNEYSLSKALGIYKSITLGSWDQQDKRNIPSDDPRQIKRTGLPHINYGPGEFDIEYLGGMYMYLQIKSFQKSRVHNFLRKTVKAGALLSAKVAH